MSPVSDSAVMDNTYINIMVLGWHFQVLRDRPWVWAGYNPCHAEQGWVDGKWRVYRLLSYTYHC
jgi:hypothetical protein